jgi:uncharacterized delta-60 repeat protein
MTDGPKLHRSFLILALLALVWLVSWQHPSPTADGQIGARAVAAGSFDAWVEARAAGEPAAMDADPAALRTGVILARQRLAALEVLARQHPGAARTRLLDLATLAGLPEEIRRECEQPWSARADFDLRWESSIDDDGNLECRHHHIVTDGHRSAAAFGPHLLEATAPLSGVFLQGHRIGGIVLLDPSPVRVLAPEDAAAAGIWFRGSRAEAVDPLTGGPARDGIPAIVAGTVHRFENRDSIESLTGTLGDLEQQARHEGRRTFANPFANLAADVGGAGGGDHQATPYQADHLKVLFIRVDFSDLAGEANSISKANLEATLETVASYVNQYSYGAASITHTVTPILYRMPSSGATYATASDGNGLLMNDARQLAAAHFTLSDYHVVAVYFPKLSNIVGSLITYGGLASVGGGNHWINGTNNAGVILHEFGHNYGLFHANYWNPAGNLGGTRYDSPAFHSVEYGDIFDRMGGGGADDGYFSPYATSMLGWLPPSKIVTPTGNGTWRIHQFDAPGATSHPQLAIRVPMGGGVYYWVGHRKRYGAPSNLANAAYVVAEGLYTRRPNLIDMTPGSRANALQDRDDCGLPVGSVYYDAAAGVRFETLASGGTAPNAWIDVNIRFEPRIGIATPAVEVDESAGFARVVLRRSIGDAGAVSVDYATADGTATAGLDYHAVSGTVRWAAGDSADKTLAIAIRPDQRNEGTETFTLTLSNPVGAVIPTGEDVATVSIHDPGRRFAGFAPGFFNTTVRAAVPLADGKVVIGGEISAGITGAPGIRHIARLNADGSVDDGFLTGLGFDGPVRAIARQQDGKLVVAGDFTSYDGVACHRLIRLNPDGTPDLDFVNACGGGPDGTIDAIAIESTGKLLLAGDFTTFCGQPARSIVRLLPSGARDTAAPLTLDPVFTTVSRIEAVHVLADGKIMIGGSFRTNYVGGAVDGFRNALARLHPDGSRDAGFEVGAGAHVLGQRNLLSNVTAIARQPDGKLLIGGGFTAWNGSPATRIVRLETNGSVDPSFAPPAIGAAPRTILAQPSGHVLVGGGFLEPEARLTRLGAGGGLDPGWNPGGQLGTSFGTVNTIVDAGEGALFVGGNFFQYGGETSRPIVRVASGGGDAYDYWRSSRFTAAQIAGGQAEPGADPNGNGLSNLLEMALGSPPTGGSAASGAAPAMVEIVRSNGQEYLQIEFRKGPDAAGLWISGQFSGGLTDWLPASPLPGSNPVYTVIEDSPTRLVLRDNTPVTAAGRRFGRIHVKRPE